METKLADAEAAAAAAAEAAEKEKAELQAKVDELTQQIEDAAKAAEEKAAEVVEEVVEQVEEAAEEPAAEEAPAEEAAAEEPAAEETAVMSYADYAAAELESAVCVETYVQDTQSWWADKITVYAQSEDGAYFIYNMACSEEDSAKLVPGAKIRVNGFKSEWSGEVEIVDATFELLEGDTFVAEAEDVTGKIGTDELIDCQNELVVFKGLTVKEYVDMEGNATGAAFAYKDDVGKTDDLYFTAEKDGVEVSFCVEFYLRGQDSDVYKAVEGLQIGDVVDVTAYLYWYNGANPHVVGVAKAE